MHIFLQFTIKINHPWIGVYTVRTQSRCDFEQMLDLAWGKYPRGVVAKTALPMCFAMVVQSF